MRKLNFIGYLLISITLVVSILSSDSFATSAKYEQHMAKGTSYMEKSDYKAAIAEFRAAVKERPGDFKATLYLGIALSRSGDKEADTMLKRAIAINPEDPRANLELGVYYFNKSMNDEAKDYLENTGKLAPGTELSAKAEEYLQIIRKSAFVRPWALNISLGGQYDSNVVLNPSGSPLPEGISGKSDWRAVMLLQGRYNIFTKEKFEGSIGYNLYQSLHSRLSDFNVSQHIFDLTATYSLSPLLSVKGTYAFEYIFVGGNGYDSAHSLSPALIITEGKGYSTIVEYRYRRDNYINSDLFFDNSDRNGSDNLVGITQNIPILPSVTARAGYFHDEDSTRTDFWDYSGDKLTAGLRLSFPSKILLDLQGEYYDVRYKGVMPSFSEKRKDRTYTVAVFATKSFSERYSVTVGELYTRNNSNIAEFEYKRAITSLFLNVRF